MTSINSSKVALVTGGAQNIGLAISKHLANCGMTVTVADINPPPKNEGDLSYIKTDVSDEQQCEDLIRFLQKGRLDVVVCAAGIAIEKKITDTTVEEWDKVMAVNARGVFLIAKHAIKCMQTCGGGSIVLIGSIEGNASNPLHAAYAASKAAVHALARNIARDHGVDNIRCNAVAPGWIQTPFNDNLLASYPDKNKAIAAIEKLHPLGNIGTPDDVAQTVHWLCREESAFINGQVICVDGGRNTQLPLPAF